MFRCCRMFIWLNTVVALALAGSSARGADWNVKADPPDEKVEWPADVKVKIAAPKSFFDAEVDFASHGGPFAALGRNGGKDEQRAVYDLRTGKRIGLLRGDLKVDKPHALSADGKLFAAAHNQRGGGFVVIDVAAGKVVQDVTTQKKPEYLEFAGKDRILAFSGWGNGAVEQFDVKTGKSLQTVPIVKDWRKGLPVASPGGNFIAVANNKNIYFYELAGGMEAGTVELPKIKDNPGNCLGLAFSADGTQLGGLFEAWGDHRVVAWNLKDGSQAVDVTIDKPQAAFYEGQKLEWIPDGSGWLVNGELVVDRESGKTLWKLADLPFQKQARRIVAAEAVLHFDTHDRNNRTLVAITQGKDKLATIRKTVREGGSAADAQLPPLKATDLKDAKVVEVPQSSKWSLAKEAAPETAEVNRRPTPIACKGSHVEGLLIVGGAKPCAIIELVSRPNPLAPPDTEKPRRVGRLDLSTGKITKQVELPPGSALVGIGQDGMSFLTTEAQEGRRVDVWSFETGKHVAGWRPYQQEPEKERKVVAARAIAPDQVVTVSSAGKIVLCSLPDCKPVYVADVPDFTAVTWTASGKYLAGLQRGVVRFVESATGKMAGDLEPPFPPQIDVNAPKVLALRPDGGEAAAVLGQAGEIPHLVRWDLASGKVIDDTPFRFVPPNGLKLQYAGTKHLLVEERDLFDLARKATVWTYRVEPMFEGRFATERPDGRCWYVASVGANQENSALVAANLPEPGVEKYVKDIADGPNAVLRPGTQVAVQVNYSGSSNGEAGTKTLEILRQSFEKRGLKLTESANLVVQLTVTQRDTGEKLEFRKLFPNIGENPFARLTVNIIELDCQSKVTMNGQPLWQSPSEKMSLHHIFGVIHLPDKNTDLTQFLYSRLWSNVPGWAERAALPRFLARTSEGVMALPGTTLLSASGAQTQKPTAQK